MQDGQFWTPTQNASGVDMLRNQPTGIDLLKGNEGSVYKPLPYTFSDINQDRVFVFGPSDKTINVDPNLYDVDKVAYQSGFTDMLNSFIHGVNQTQISASQYGLFNNQNRIAQIEGGVTFRGELQNLESQRLAKQIDDIEYTQKKSELQTELSQLKSDNQRIQNSILNDQKDITATPVSKAYQMREQELQGLGAEAGLLDSLYYTQPQAAGSSFSTLGATIVNTVGARFVQKLAARAAASLTTGPAAPFVSGALALGTLFESAYYARQLESQAEVGGAISEDFEALKKDYLQKTGKQELSPAEYNELITQAHKGADQQYWKNMSLSASDAIQALVLSGTVSKWFESAAMSSKLGRIATRLGEFYLEAKSEELEEGLQYAFQREKNAAARGQSRDSDGFFNTVFNKDFINSLKQNYVDTLSSMNFGPLKGDGKYSGDREFEFSTQSGFLLGAIMGGASSIMKTTNDIYNYKRAVKDLQAAGLEDAESNSFKFKADIYKSYFEPKGGLLNPQTSEDRVHFLREAVKTLGTKTDQNGKPMLTQDEVQTELKNIDSAFENYKDVSSYLENLAPGFNKQDSELFGLASKKFGDAVFRDSVLLTHTNNVLQDAKNKQAEVLSKIFGFDSNIINLRNQLQVINRRIDTIENIQVGEDLRNKKLEYLNKRKADIEAELEQAKADMKAANIQVSGIREAPLQLTSANEDLLTAEMYNSDVADRYEKLLKVKTTKKLIDWFRAEVDNEVFEGVTSSSQQLRALRQQQDATTLANRENKPYDTLTEEEETLRSAENKSILNREGYSDEAINEMSYEDRDKLAREILETYAQGKDYSSTDNYLELLANVKDEAGFKRAFNMPQMEHFIKDTLGLDRQDSFQKIVDAAKVLNDQRKSEKGTNKKQRTTTGTLSNKIKGRLKNTNDTRTEADLRKEFKVSNNKASQRDVLNAVILSQFSTEAEKELARQLLKITEDSDNLTFDNNNNAPGSFIVNTREIIVNPTFSAYDYQDANQSIETVILHELVHKYTAQAVEEADNVDLKARLRNLFNFVTEQAKLKNQFDKFYGLTNQDEFMTEAMTSPEFQAFLKSLSYKTTKQTAWDTFIQFVNEALKALGIISNQTSLDEIISIVSGLVDRNNRESFSTIRDRITKASEDTIHTRNSMDQNTVAASALYKEIYDLSDNDVNKYEKTILQDIVKTRLTEINNQIKPEDQIKFGSHVINKGDYVVVDGKILYQFSELGTKNEFKNKPLFRAVNLNGIVGNSILTIDDPVSVTNVFSNQQDAIDFIKSGINKPESLPEEPTNNVSDAFGKALTDLENYSAERLQYGSLDPKLIEIGTRLIQEALKLGKQDFKSISQEILTRVGNERYKAIFNNLRAVYVASFADMKGKLNDSEGEILNLVTGKATADSVISDLKSRPALSGTTFTGSTATQDEVLQQSKQNAIDRITGELMKTTGQQFQVNKDGTWSGELDSDPVKVRYYNFLRKMNDQTSTSGKTMTQLGYYATLVQDGETFPDGTVIPHEKNTIDYINAAKAKGQKVKLGQIAVITDVNGKIIKFNQDGDINTLGEPVVFNIESVATAGSKDLRIVSKAQGVTEEQAKQMVIKASKDIEAVRNSAKSGVPVLLELTPTNGVPVFSTEQSSMAPLASQNLHIEIPTVPKDNTNVGYFSSNPNMTGFLGGAYVFLNGVPVKLEPTTISESMAKNIIAILDEQNSAVIGEEEVKARSQFLNSLVFQSFDSAGQKSSFYFKGKNVYVNGAKVAPAERLSAIMQYGRYNIDNKLLNSNWRLYVASPDGTIKLTAPSSYNKFILQRTTSLASLSSDGTHVYANGYFTFKINRQLTDWQSNEVAKPAPKPAETAAPKNVPLVTGLDKNFKAQKQNGVKLSLNDAMALIDFNETGLGGLENQLETAEGIYITNLKVGEDGSRLASIYIYQGSHISASNAEVTEIVLHPIPSTVVESPATPSEEVKQTQVSNEADLEAKKAALKEKFRKQKEALMQNLPDLNKDIEDTMTSIGRSIEYTPENEHKISQRELDWFSNIFFKSYSGKLAARELRITTELINSNLWGQFTENGIRLFKDAPEGTLYHEAFHEFSQLYLTLDEKRELYSSARKSIPSLKNQTDFQVEEHLAEEFRKYVLAEGKYKITPNVGNIFQRIYNYIKSLFFGKTAVEEAFDRLYTGQINNYQPNINNIQFKRLNAGIQDSIGNSLFDSTQSLTVVRSIDRLIYDFIHSYDKSIVDTLNAPRIIEAAYKFAYKIFVDKLTSLNADFEAKMNDITDESQFDAAVATFEKSSKKFNDIVSNWNSVMAYHQIHSQTFIIKGQTISFTFDQDGNILEEGDDRQAETAKTRYDSVSGNEISSIDGANKETKALVRGLGKARRVGENVVPQINEFGIQELVDFGSTFNNLALNLQGSMEFDHMIAKLENLSIAFPEYQELLSKLGTNKPKSELTVNQISQLAKFRQDFSKPYIGIHELVFDPTVGLYKFIEATNNNISSIEALFTDNFTIAPVSKYIKVNEFGSNILTEEIKNLPLGSRQEKIAFLSTIGVIFSPETLKDNNFDSVVSGRALSTIKNALVKLIDNGVEVTNPLAQVRRPVQSLQLPGEAGNIDPIIELEAKYNRANASASMINAEGSTVYALSLHNMLSVSGSYLNDAENYPTYQSVVALPHMAHLDIQNNPYVRNSIWLNELFNLDMESPNFGERKKQNGEIVKLELINYNGLKVQKEQGASEGSTTTGLWIGDKLVQDFNTLLTAGTKEMMRAGDKASAFAFRLPGYTQEVGRADKLPIRLEAFTNSYGGLSSVKIMSGYLIDELKRMQDARFNNIGSNLDYYNKTAKDFNLFSGILSEEAKKALESDLKSDTDIEALVIANQVKIKEDIRNFFAQQVKDKKESFIKYQFGISEKPTWVDSTLKSKYNFEHLLRAYVVNAFILNVEQTKIFNGDGAFYKAFHKRNSKDSSTGTTMMTDQWFLDWLNNDKNTNLQSKLLGVNNPVNNITNTVVFKDNEVGSAYMDIYRKQLTNLGLDAEKVESIASKYGAANEGDAQGWITLDFYRTFKLAQGKWFPQHEAIYEKASKGEQLTPEEVFYFMPIKSQYAGPLQYSGIFAPAFHKFSLVPLLPSVIKGTKMEAMNEKMIRNNVGYGVFESGSKVATILDSNGSKESFYQDYKERTAVDPNSNFGVLNPIFNHYLKEQVNIDPSLHDEVIFGTQFRKLLFQNLFTNGQALNEKWSKLYDEYSNILDDLVNNERQRLLDELGLEEKNGEYHNVDFTKLVNKFLQEAGRRNMNMNVSNFMEYDKDSKTFKYPLDASTNRQQIQNMIMSIINNRLVRQQMNGDLMVQVSSAGFEKYQKPTDAQIEQYGTNGLRFYHLKDGKTQSMQVKIPLNGDFENLLYFKHKDGNSISTPERLNEMLRDESWVEENRKAVTMIGYRIPTQGLNSIEFMEVAEFLPPEAGNILILPTEIVIKSGSDYDIDKLSIFKPSIRNKYTFNKTTGAKEVISASYVEPRTRSLSISIDEQRIKAQNKYDELSAPIKNTINKLRDDNYLNTRYLKGLKAELKEKLNLDYDSAIEKYNDSIHKVAELSYAMLLAQNDLDVARAERGLIPGSELDETLLPLQYNVNQIYLERQQAVEEQKIAKAEFDSMLVTKRVLSSEAEKVINQYREDYFTKMYDLKNDLLEITTEYENEMETLRNFKSGLQNRIIEIGREVLSDVTNFEQLITPNDTGLIKPMITDKGGIKNKNGYPSKTDYTGTAIYTEKTQEEKFLAGLVGKKALGIAAVNNTFTQLFEIIGLKLNKKYQTDRTKEQGLDTVIRLLDNQPDVIDMSNVYDERGILKSEFISQMVNAYVDVLNDDFIFYANAGLDVAPVIFYLKNAGVSTEKIMYFINHPIIKEYVNKLQATKSHVFKGIYPGTFDMAYRMKNGIQGSYKSELIKKLTNFDPKAKSLDVLNSLHEAGKNSQFFKTEFLFNRISDNLNDIGEIERRAILGQFLELQDQAELLRKFQAGNSYDTATAPNPVASKMFEENQEEARRLVALEYQKKIANTVIKAYNVSGLVSEMFENLMPVTLGKDVINYILEHNGEFSKDQTQFDKYTRLFSNDLLLYIFSNYVTLDTLRDKPTAFDYINGTESRPSMFQINNNIDKRLSTRFKEFKSDPAFKGLKQQYPIINQIRPTLINKTNGFTNIEIYRGENNADIQNSLIEQFTKLGNFSDPAYTKEQQLQVRKLFKDLALFGFAQSGLNKSPISFTDIIPNEFYTPIISRGITAFKNDIKNRGFMRVMDEYNYMFIKNNPELSGEITAIPSYRYKNYRLNINRNVSESVAKIAEPTVPAKTLNLYQSINEKLSGEALPISKFLEDDDLYFINVSNLSKENLNIFDSGKSTSNMLSKVTADNFEQALSTEKNYVGKNIVFRKHNTKFSITSLEEDYGDAKIDYADNYAEKVINSEYFEKFQQILHSGTASYKGDINNLILYYVQGQYTSEEEKSALEESFKNMGILNQIFYNPNQLSLFPTQELENNGEKRILNYGDVELNTTLRNLEEQSKKCNS